MIGKTLKIIRENRGITQHDFSKKNVSPSFYSRVESGISQISATLLFSLLENNKVTVKEFYYIKKNYKNEEQTTILNQMRLCFHKSDLQSLDILYQDLLTNQSDENYLCLIKNLKKHIKNEEINQADVQALKKYLLSIPVWGHYEFQLFSLCSYLFTADTLVLLANNVVRTLDRYEGLATYEQDLLAILINLTRAMLKENDLNAATHYLHLAKIFQKNPLLIYEHLLINFYEQLIQFKNGETTNIEEAKYIIEIFTMLKMEQTSKHLKTILAF